MTDNSEPSKTENDLQAVKKGALEVLVPGKTIFFRGAALNQAAYLAQIDNYLTPYETVNDQRTALTQSVAARNAQEPAAQQFVQDSKLAAGNTFGTDSAEFTKFGFEPRKKAAALTPEEKQLKHDHLLATRAKNGTLGKRQARLAAKGIVEPASGAATPPAAPPSGNPQGGGAGSSVTKP